MPKTVKDADGNEFPSIKAMCAAHGVGCATFKKRRSVYKMDLRRALTPGRLMCDKAIPQTDHLGNSYPSIRAMCRAWHVGHETYVHRLELGLSKEEALTHKGALGHKACTGPNGKKYPSFKAMCDDYGVRKDMCETRIKRGMSLLQALTEPDRKHTASTDIYGNNFRSIKDMCDAWEVKFATYSANVRAGRPDPLIRAAVAAWPGTDAGSFRIRECIAFPWFLCEDLSERSDDPHAGELVLRADQVLAMKHAGTGHMNE